MGKSVGSGLQCILSNDDVLSVQPLSTGCCCCSYATAPRFSAACSSDKLVIAWCQTCLACRLHAVELSIGHLLSSVLDILLKI
jgi:hypothetical protein